MEPKQELDAWRRWRERCALERLESAERDRLTVTIAERFRSRVRQVSLRRRDRLSAPSDRDCAHLFESFCALHRRQDGKKYKHWLLERGRKDLDTVQSGVMLLCRNVVREWIRDAFPVTAEVSLQQVVPSGVRLEHLLPGSAPRVENPELAEWIRSRLTGWAEELHPVERKVLSIRRSGRVFSDPAVLAEAPVGKSTLHKYHRGLLFRLAGEVQRDFPDLDPADASHAVLRILDELGEMIFSEISAENSGSAGFGRVEAHDERI